MAKVYVRKDESIESAMKRFKSAVQKDGILRELKKREYFLTPTQKKRMKKLEARKRYLKNLKKRLQREERNDRKQG